MKIGYARVSTEDQNLEIQCRELKSAGCTKIFQEKISGTKKQRPELAKALEHLRENDTFIVWRLDRLARSTRGLLEIIETIKATNADFLSISEPWANTTSHAGKMIMTFFAGIAEFEKDLIRDRTGTGREAALKRGVKFGRPLKIKEEQRILIARLLTEGKSIKECAKTFSVHPTTIYRALEANPLEEVA
jgi:DNA invertase Pin-like site-specific DNA recombinase